MSYVTTHGCITVYLDSIVCIVSSVAPPSAARLRLPLCRRVRIQYPRTLHPRSDRRHAAGKGLFFHGQGSPREAVLDGEHEKSLRGSLP